MYPPRRMTNRPQYRRPLTISLLSLLIGTALFYACTGTAKPPAPSSIIKKETHVITIASFNIRNFSNKSRDEKELKYIALLLKPYDLIAIQELRDAEVLKRTLSILKGWGYDFGYEISSPVGHHVKELYAFLYRKDKIAVLQKGHVYDDTYDLFIREPFYARFKAQNFDFILLTVHILYGSGITQRRPELLALSHVYDEIQAKNPSEHDIIVVGDFNLPPNDAGWTDFLRKPSMTYLIKPPAKTIITDTSLYDNFWFQTQFVREYAAQTGIIKFDEDIFHNDDPSAEKAVSDHRPIWAKFAVDDADDD